MEIRIRPIEARDNAAIARIIRDTLAEYKANKPGTVYFDPTTDHLSELFKKENSCYYVVEAKHEILGGCGIYPTEGLPDPVQSSPNDHARTPIDTWRLPQQDK